MRKKSKIKSRRTWLVILILVVILSAAGIFFLNYFLKSAEPSDEQIIKKISKFDLPEGAPWITKIENAAEQARLYPALFSGTKDGQYALRYGTLFAVYDYQEDKIIRRIPIIRINISQ